MKQINLGVAKIVWGTVTAENVWDFAGEYWRLFGRGLVYQKKEFFIGLKRRDV